MLRRARIPTIVFAFAWVLAPAVAGANGDVSVGAVTPGGDLSINGDAGNNDFTVTQNPNGTVTVTGNNGTTINGGASHTTSAAVTGKISANGRGGDDTIKVDGVNVGEVKVKDELGTNTIEVRGSRISGELDLKNRDGSIRIRDTAWGRRKIRPGQGSVDPANLAGRGGAGSVGTPPSGGGGGKKPAAKKKAPLEAQKQGLPTSNPGQRGVVVPELPNQPGGYGGSKTPSYPKSKY
jgi:hypothetical protein